MHEQFSFSKAAVNELCFEFFNAEVSIISIVSEDIPEDKHKINSNKNESKNKLSEEKSSEKSNAQASDLSELERYLLDEFKAIDITNRI